MDNVNKNYPKNDGTKSGEEFWQSCYNRKVTRWQVDTVHKLLVKYINLLEPQKSSTIFVPLCGKSLDIQWLYLRGNNVIAVDIVEEAILEQFRLLNVAYNVSEASNGVTIYESDDKRVTMIKCDFLTFDCSEYANTVDCVWDRASIIALAKENHKLYVAQISKMLKPKFSYLLETITYDESKMEGPPFCITREKVEEYYGNFCKIHQLENESVETSLFRTPATFHAFHLSNK